MRRAITTLEHNRSPLILTVLPGEVLKPDSVKMVRGEGMPINGDPFRKGNLFVKFEINYPDKDWASHTDLSAVEKMLPKRTIPQAVLTDDCEEVHVEDPDYTHQGKGGSGRAYQEDDDDEGPGGHGEGVQCQSQ